jgi:predicted peptidase
MARTTWLLVVIGVCLVPPEAVRADSNSDWVKKTYTNAKKEQLPYRLLEPANRDPKAVYPLLVFMHGRGSRGTDNEKQLGDTVLQFANKEHRKKYPCFIVAPQCSKKEPHDFWAKTVDGGIVMEMIKDLERKHRIDPKRVYITGISDGGWGVWAFLERDPNKIAAAIPICGRGEPKAAAKFAKIPIWVFHGTKDTTEPVKSSREMVAALKKAGGSPKYTEFADEGHNVWDKAYHDPKVFEWLFAQKRK